MTSGAPLCRLNTCAHASHIPEQTSLCTYTLRPTKTMLAWSQTSGASHMRHASYAWPFTTRVKTAMPKWSSTRRAYAGRPRIMCMK